MNRKKTIITMVITLVLVAAIGAGATVAFLTDKTNTLTNTFTFGKVEMELFEHNEDGTENFEGIRYENMYPGQTVSKDPTARVKADSVDCYVFIKVTGIDALESVGFTVGKIDSSVWEKQGDKNGKKDGVYRYVGTKADDNYAAGVVLRSDKDVTLPALFETVQYNDNEEGAAEGIEIPSIDLVGCAVQAKNVSVSDAYKEVADKLAK